MEKRRGIRGKMRIRELCMAALALLGHAFLLCAGLGISSAVPGEILSPASQTYKPAAVLTAPLRALTEETGNKETPARSTFLRTIGVPEAWSILSNNVDATIAIVDTGVDLDHPKLAPYLTDGVNLLETGKPPQDDNGHGTAVAGVIAAIADTATGGEREPADGKTSGSAGTESAAGTASSSAAATGDGSAARWRGKIMPVKALDARGEGDENYLTEGIRYAVRHGADIVVLSLGLRRDAPTLREAVAYAEREGVLLVAATGNDAATFGNRAAVQYPAAYASVLAVAGADGAKASTAATHGAEVDLAAAWQVDTLAVGGGHTTMQGTSMGAPQAAAAAAMALSAHPAWTPLQLREALRASARDLAPEGFDPQTGYGLLRIDRLLAAGDRADWRETGGGSSAEAAASPAAQAGAPSNAAASGSGSAQPATGKSVAAANSAKAEAFPLGKEVAGAWSGASDVDAYAIIIPYDGTLVLQGDVAAEGWERRLKLQTAASGGSQSNTIKPSSALHWPVRKGKTYRLVAAAPAAASASKPVAYRFVSSLRISPDAMEPNDSKAEALTVPSNMAKWSGTFHRIGDVDWTVVDFPKRGTLKLTVTTDTTRIDPSIQVMPAEGVEKSIDEYGDGESEELVLKEAGPGKIYIRVRNEAGDTAEPVIGTYAVELEYSDVYEHPAGKDGNESPSGAKTLKTGVAYEQSTAPGKNTRWFRFSLPERLAVNLALTEFADNARVSVALKSKQQQTIMTWENEAEAKQMHAEKVLGPGVYYVAVTASVPAESAGSFYTLRLTTSAAAVLPLWDADGHWAERPIRAVAGKGWLVGYANGAFAPDRPITRAEAVASIVRAVRPGKTGLPKPLPFTDLRHSHWAYSAVEQAEAAGWLAGYEARFDPALPVMRGEAAMLLAKAASLQLSRPTGTTFGDVPATLPTAGAIEALSRKGWASGYADGTFRPNGEITRAEWAKQLASLLG